MGMIETPSGWWEFEGEEPPGLFVARPDEGGDPDAVRAMLRVVDDDGANDDDAQALRR